MNKAMDKNVKIYVAGHRGLVGSAILQRLTLDGYTNIVTRTHFELDLTNQLAVSDFFEQERPNYVFLAAAKVGGIHANNVYPGEFIRDNIAIQCNVIHSAYRSEVSRLLFLGSSCIYPKFAPQPLREESLLTSGLEPTNRPYALAKIAGIEMCWAYNRQYKTRFLAAMPTNLYGPGDNYHPENSHVIPALIRRFHEAKVTRASSVSVWGTGEPKREFLFSEDMADACVHIMNLPDENFVPLLGQDRNDGLAPLINVGAGVDVSVRELAELIRETVGYDGTVEFDSTKPDGTPRKLMDTKRVNSLGWYATKSLRDGLHVAYGDFLASTGG